MYIVLLILKKKSRKGRKPKKRKTMMNDFTNVSIEYMAVFAFGKLLQDFAIIFLLLLIIIQAKKWLRFFSDFCLNRKKINRMIKEPTSLDLNFG